MGNLIKGLMWLVGGMALLMRLDPSIKRNGLMRLQQLLSLFRRG